MHHAYLEDKNGVTQIHLKAIMDALFGLESAASRALSHGVSAPEALMLVDRIQSTLYKICTRYASALHALDIDPRHLERFMSYADYRV